MLLYVLGSANKGHMHSRPVLSAVRGDGPCGGGGGEPAARGAPAGGGVRLDGDCGGRGVGEPALKARPSPGARDPGSVMMYSKYTDS